MTGVYNWAVFLYLTVDLAGCYVPPTQTHSLVRAAKLVCWILLLLALLGVFGKHA